MEVVARAIEAAIQAIKEIFIQIIDVLTRRSFEKTAVFKDLVEELDEDLRHYAPAYANPQESLNDDDLLEEARPPKSGFLNRRKNPVFISSLPGPYSTASTLKYLRSESDTIWLSRSSPL